MLVVITNLRAQGSRYNRRAHQRLDLDTMQPIDDRDRRRYWLTSVLTDIHFWVPIVVLIGGLLLLESIR